MPDYTALASHLAKIAADTRAFVAADPNNWACHPVEDVQFWVDQGISTVEQFEKHSLASEVYDFHKEVWGFKPSWKSLTDLSIVELEIEMDKLRDWNNYNAEQESYYAEQAKLDIKWQTELDAQHIWENPIIALVFSDGFWQLNY